MEYFTFFQLILIYLLLFFSFLMLVDRICKAFEKCSLGKSAAIASAITRRVNNDGNRIISSTEGSTE